jgi:hypothetical protein
MKKQKLLALLLFALESIIVKGLVEILRAYLNPSLSN